MHAMTCYITIGNRTFQRCNSIRVKSSRKTLSDTAIVKLANVKTLLNDPNKRINVGDSIEISTGYNGNNTLEFAGYIAEIMPTTPIELRCEDEMWQLKQQEVSKSWESVKLADVLKFLVSSVNTVKCPDITISPFRLNKVTKYRALEMIKEGYGIDIYFRDKTLYAGLAYNDGNGKNVKYHFQKNVPSSSLQTGLIYKKSTDVKIKVNAVSLSPDNKKIEVNVGDTDGELHTLHFFNLTESELKQQATNMIDKFKYDGYRGNLKTFGIPVVKHGDVAVLQDANYPDKAGNIFVDSVELDYSQNGYRRIVELGKKAS